MNHNVEYFSGKLNVYLKHEELMLITVVVFVVF